MIKEIKTRWEQSPTHTKVGFCIGAPFLAVLLLVMSPLILFIWLVKCLSEILDDGYDSAF